MKPVRFVIESLLYSLVLPAIACFTFTFLVNRQSDWFVSSLVIVGVAYALMTTTYIVASLFLSTDGRVCWKMFIGAGATFGWTLCAMLTLDAHEMLVFELVVITGFSELALLSYEKWKSALQKTLPIQ